MRPQLVAQSRDQRVQTATAAASVVDTSAGVCADIRAAVGAAAPSTAAVGTVASPPSGMGRGSSAVGLGGNLTAPTAVAVGSLGLRDYRHARRLRDAHGGENSRFMTKPGVPVPLKAANGEVIASIEGYESKANAEKGIESVKTNAAGAADASTHRPGL